MPTREDFRAVQTTMQALADSNVPVGAIIPFWGAKTGIPNCYQLCDGGAITAPDALLKGNTPDLTDYFLQGAKAGTTDVTILASAGTHQVTGVVTSDTALTEAQLPKHGHPANSHPHRHANNLDFIFAEGGNGSERLIIPDAHLGRGGVPSPGHRNDHGNDNYLCGASDMIGHASMGVSSGATGGGSGHKHALPSWDNRPATRSVFFIVRIK